MDYFKRIQNSIEYIEEQLQNELSITEISSKSYFSAFHFQRLFQAITGFSVQQYIRNRRLSEAAQILVTTSTNILVVAISFQYSSQEAFTRAFANYFGITPAKYRKVKNTIPLQTKIYFLDYKINGELMMKKPEIVHLQKKLIIGSVYNTTLQDDKYFVDIPQFYFDFGENQYYKWISNKVAPNMAYGITTNFQEDGHFSFIVGEEVQKYDIALNGNFVNFEIPEENMRNLKLTELQNTFKIQDVIFMEFGYRIQITKEIVVLILRLPM